MSGAAFATISAHLKGAALNGEATVEQVQLMGRRIRRLRRKNKLTQPALAERVGIPASDLSRIERDEVRVSLDVLVRIVAECNVGLDELMSDSAARRSGDRRRGRAASRRP